MVIKDNFKDSVYSTFLLIKIIFAVILSGLIVMRKLLEKNGKNIILGHIAFSIVLLQQISVYL